MVKNCGRLASKIGGGGRWGVALENDGRLRIGPINIFSGM